MDDVLPIDDGVAVIICRLVGAQCELYINLSVIVVLHVVCTGSPCLCVLVLYDVIAYKAIC